MVCGLCFRVSTPVPQGVNVPRAPAVGPVRPLPRRYVLPRLLQHPAPRRVQESFVKVGVGIAATPMLAKVR